MLDRTDEQKLILICDYLEEDQHTFERIARSMPLDARARTKLASDIARSAMAGAQRLVGLLGEDSARWGWARHLLHQHPLHRDYILQSDLMREALHHGSSPLGRDYLERLVLGNVSSGSSLYGVLENDAYQSLPVFEAMRWRARSFRRMLRLLPEGGRALGVGCRSIWATDGLLQASDRNRQLTLTDQPPREGAYDLICVTCLDSADMVDAADMAAKLFDCLTPGGKLVIGAFLTPGDGNTHQVGHRFMLEAYADWMLAYRSLSDVRRMAESIPVQASRITWHDETLVRPLTTHSVMGCMIVKRF
jgi:hypothetical protein